METLWTQADITQRKQISVTRSFASVSRNKRLYLFKEALSTNYVMSLGKVSSSNKRWRRKVLCLSLPRLSNGRRSLHLFRRDYTVLRKFYLKEERLKCLSKSKQEALKTTSTLFFRNLSNVSSYIFFNAFQSNVRKFLCEIKVKQILARHW